MAPIGKEIRVNLDSYLDVLSQLGQGEEAKKLGESLKKLGVPDKVSFFQGPDEGDGEIFLSYPDQPRSGWLRFGCNRNPTTAGGKILSCSSSVNDQNSAREITPLSAKFLKIFISGLYDGEGSAFVFSKYEEAVHGGLQAVRACYEDGVAGQCVQGDIARAETIIEDTERLEMGSTIEEVLKWAKENDRFYNEIEYEPVEAIKNECDSRLRLVEDPKKKKEFLQNAINQLLADEHVRERVMVLNGYPSSDCKVINETQSGCYSSNSEVKCTGTVYTYTDKCTVSFQTFSGHYNYTKARSSDNCECSPRGVGHGRD